jgi:hypothetical protein
MLSDFANTIRMETLQSGTLPARGHPSGSSSTLQFRVVGNDSFGPTKQQSFDQEPSNMGLFWDLMQQSQISEQRDAAQSVEERVAALETQLKETQELQRRLITVLEEHFGRDIDGDGTVG